MRKIEQEMCKAIGQKRSWKNSNTEVEYECELDEPTHARMEQAKVYLWGNHIGTFLYRDLKFHVNRATLARWPTRTTKSRIRALGGLV
jgi:hypothetical protein